MTLPDFSLLSLLLIITEICLITFCAYRIIKHFRKGRLTGIQKKLSRPKLVAYGLIFLCFSIQLVSQLNAAYNLFIEDIYLKRTLYLFCEILPSLLVFSLAMDLALFWQQLYSCFEEDTETLEKTIARLEKYYIISNISIYSLAIILGTTYIINGSDLSVVSLLILLEVALLSSTTLFSIQAWRIYEKAKGLMGQFTISSKKKFVVLAVSSVCCFLVKSVFEVSVIYNSWVDHELNLSILYSLKQLSGFQVMELMYIIGEFGSLLSFVLLLELHSQQTKTSIATASTFVEDLEEYLHDRDDVVEAH